MTFEITKIDLVGDDVTFYFNNENEPFSSREFDPEFSLRRRLEKLERRLVRWNNRNLVHIHEIQVKDKRCVFQYDLYAQLVNRLTDGRSQRRFERMERVINRWNAYYN